MSIARRRAALEELAFGEKTSEAVRLRALESLEKLDGLNVTMADVYGSLLELSDSELDVELLPDPRHPRSVCGDASSRRSPSRYVNPHELLVSFQRPPTSMWRKGRGCTGPQPLKLTTQVRLALRTPVIRSGHL